MLANTKIATKIIFMVMMLSAVGLSVAYMSTRVLLGADVDYSNLLANDSNATLLLARANQNAVEVAYASYRNIIYDGATEEAKDSAAIAKMAFTSAIDSINQSRLLLPKETSQIDRHPGRSQGGVRPSG